MKCQNCESILAPSVAFCTGCGTKVLHNSTHQELNIEKQSFNTNNQTGFDISKETKSFVEFLKSTVTNPFDAFQMNTTKNTSIFFFVAIILLSSFVGSFFFSEGFNMDIADIAFATIAVQFSYNLALTGIIYFIFKVLKNENINFLQTLNVTTTALIINFVFQVALIGSLLLESPTLFALIGISSFVAIIGVYLLNLSKVIKSKLLLLYSLGPVMAISLYISSKIFANFVTDYIYKLL